MFSDLFTEMDQEIITSIGNGFGLYDSKVKCSVLLDKNVERITEVGEIYYNQLELTTINSEVNIERGKPIIIECTTYYIVDIISNDGSITTSTIRL